MQEEVTQKSMDLAIKVSKLSFQALYTAVNRLLVNPAEKKLQQKSAVKQTVKQQEALRGPRGKQKVSELIHQDEETSSIPIDKTDLKGFEKYLRKYGVDWAITKEKASGNYTVFFKAKDSAALKSAFQDYNQALEKKARPSAQKQMEKAKAKVTEAAKGSLLRNKQPEGPEL